MPIDKPMHVFKPKACHACPPSPNQFLSHSFVMSSMSQLSSGLTSERDGAATSIVSVPSGRLESDMRRFAKPAFCTARSNRLASLTFHRRFSLGM